MSDPEETTAFVGRFKDPMQLDYTIVAGRDQSLFLKAIRDGRLLAQRCPVCEKVYVPPRGACPTCAVATGGEIELAGTGTLTTFCVIDIPFPGQQLEPPYAAGSILLDGADVLVFHLVSGLPLDEVRMGLRVRALWAAPEDRGYTLNSIKYFEPTGEPDTDFAAYEEHL